MTLTVATEGLTKILSIAHAYLKLDGGGWVYTTRQQILYCIRGSD